MYFTSKSVENTLIEIINKDLNFVDESILKFRVMSEFGQIIASQIQAMQSANFEIGIEVVNVITRNYSNFYLSELTHLSKREYNEEFMQYYGFYFDYFNNKKKLVSLLEIGSGVANLAFFLNNSIDFIQSYTVCEINSELIALSHYIYPKLLVEFVECDFRKLSIDTTYDCVIAENVLKFVDLIDVYSFFESIFKKSESSEIIILDNIETISKICNLCFLKNLNVNLINNNRIVIRKG